MRQTHNPAAFAKSIKPVSVSTASELVPEMTTWQTIGSAPDMKEDGLTFRGSPALVRKVPLPSLGSVNVALPPTASEARRRAQESAGILAGRIIIATFPGQGISRVSARSTSELYIASFSNSLPGIPVPHTANCDMKRLARCMAVRRVAAQ